jgi:hypothetical protein
MVALWLVAALGMALSALPPVAHGDWFVVAYSTALVVLFVGMAAWTPRFFRGTPRAKSPTVE